MSITLRPSAAPDRQIDLTSVLVKAVAEELWRTCGGNDVLNWMEAEQFVQSLAGRNAAPSTMHTVEPRPARVPVRSREDGRRTQSLRRDDDRITGPLPGY